MEANVMRVTRVGNAMHVTRIIKPQTTMNDNKLSKTVLSELEKLNTRVYDTLDLLVATRHILTVLTGADHNLDPNIEEIQKATPTDIPSIMEDLNARLTETTSQISKNLTTIRNIIGDR